MIRILTGCLFLAFMMAQSASAQTPSSPATSAQARILPNTVEERVRACASCHGEGGRGISNVYFPRLAGKPAGYLYNQLVAFRDGRRKYAPMNYLLAYQPNEYLRKMAEYYAQLQTPFDTPSSPAVSQEVLQRGKAIVTGGEPARQVPACVACHGSTLGGREPGIPGLLGLRADYISAQLGGWRYGTRSALEPDCMQLVAARLTESDVAAVSSWLSSQQVPADIHPLPASNQVLPLNCGSQKSR